MERTRLSTRPTGRGQKYSRPRACRLRASLLDGRAPRTGTGRRQKRRRYCSFGEEAWAGWKLGL